MEDGQRDEAAWGRSQGSEATSALKSFDINKYPVEEHTAKLSTVSELEDGSHGAGSERGIKGKASSNGFAHMSNEEHHNGHHNGFHRGSEEADGHTSELRDAMDKMEEELQEHAHHIHEQAEKGGEELDEHAHRLHEHIANAEDELHEHAHDVHEHAEQAEEGLLDKAADWVQLHHRRKSPPPPLHAEYEELPEDALGEDNAAGDTQEEYVQEETPDDAANAATEEIREENYVQEAETEGAAEPEAEVAETPYASEEPQPQEQPIEDAQQQQPSSAARPFLIRTQQLRVSRWEPAPYEARDDSEDEFEQSTCRLPICDDDGEAATFQNGKPTCEGEVTSCFDDPHLLYRIIDEKTKTWYFYNDSLVYEMHVEFVFGKNSKIEALGHTTLHQNDDGSFAAELTVYPTETQPFIQGSVNGYTSKLRAVPLHDSYHEGCRDVTEAEIRREVAAIEQVCDSKDAEDVLQACLTHGIPFVDPEFPPCQASLDAGATKPFRPLAWARPHMYLPEELIDEVRLFRCAVQPGAVEAGELGDYWVMCSVAAVSEDPERLIGMFRHPYGKAAAQREHAVGAYRVTFNKNGWWRSVLVDDYVPIAAGKPKFARSARDPAEIWPCILEKAFAKLHGSYAKIVTGDPLHALHDMTGFSTFRIDAAMKQGAESTEDTAAADAAFDDLLRALQCGYTVICSTPGKDASDAAGNDLQLTEEYKSVGLLTGHAYTILDARHLPELATRLVKVRNSWGRGLEWSGDWCDADSRWEQYPEVAEACNFTREADGTFWMPWESALMYFNGGGICYTHKPAYDYRLNCAFNDCIPSTVLDLRVHAPTWLSFVISQEDRRCREDGAEYQPVMISVAVPTQPEEAEGQNYRVALNSAVNGAQPSEDKWVFLQARDVSLIRKFEPGRYLVVPRLMPMDEQPAQVPFVLGVISNKEIGGADAAIEFCRLPAECRVFENFPTFDAELIGCDDVQYQKCVPNSRFPQTLTGAAIE